MGRPFLLYFDEFDPNVHFYLCRCCRTHIALADDFHYNFTLEGGLNGGIFGKVVNVQVDGPAQHRRVGGHNVADFYCVKCGYRLGLKLVEAVGHVGVDVVGMFHMPMTKLLYWTGNNIVDAETEEPVPENE